MEYICEQLLKPISEVIAMEFMNLWEEYEIGETKEAVFVKDGQFCCYFSGIRYQLMLTLSAMF